MSQVRSCYLTSDAESFMNIQRGNVWRNYNTAAPGHLNADRVLVATIRNVSIANAEYEYAQGGPSKIETNYVRDHPRGTSWLRYKLSIIHFLFNYDGLRI